MTLAELNRLLATNYSLAADQVSMTYSDEYELVAQEHQKHQSIYGEMPDYQLILQNAVVLLQNGSGHFLVLVSLTHAMIQLYQWEGWVEACKFLNQTLNQHWESLYPGLERLKGRSQMLGWLIERCERYLANHPVSSLNAAMTDSLLSVLIPLQNTLNGKFNDALSLYTLIRPLEDQQRRLRSEAESRAAKQQAEAERAAREAEAAELRKQQALQQTLEAGAMAVTTDEYLANLDTGELHQLASKRLMAEQMEILQDNPFCYAIYKHNRAQMWWRYPLSGPELLNLIDTQGFDWQRYSEIKRLKAEERYEEALLAFEALSHEYPFYLPLQLHICDCLEELEAEQALLDMLKAECKALWQQYPELNDAKINNGFAVLDRHVRNYFNLNKPSREETH